MDASVRLDHQLIAMETENAVHVMVELAFPDAPDQEERAPLHVALVLDRSGSMSGEKLETTKACAAHLARRLRADDELAIVAFDDDVDLVAALAPVQPDKLVAAISGIWPGGSTNLSGGWLKGVEELGRATGEGRKALVLLTDGQANVGVVEPDRLTGMVAGAKQKGALTSTIGFGDDFDEELLTAMADAGGGNAHYAPGPDAAPAIFAEEFDGLAATVAQNVSLEIRPADEVQMLAVLHDYPITSVPGGVQVALGDAWGGERRRIVFRLAIPAMAELGPKTVGEVVLRWVDVTGAPAMHTVTVPVKVNVADADTAATAEPDGEVVEEVVVLEAAEAEREARKRADEGDHGGAVNALRTTAARLRDLPYSAALAARVDELETTAAAIDASGFDAVTSKTMHYRSRQSSRTRRPRS